MDQPILPATEGAGELVEPRQRDSDRSRQQILDAARDEFAGHGLSGARVDRIAAGAGVNKRLIYYYFGSKDGLFTAVLEAAYADIRAAEQRLHLTELQPPYAIRRLVEFTWNYYIEHPEFLSLLNSENLHQARHLEESQRVREMNSPLIQTLEEVLERGRQSGVFRAGIDPMQLYISIAGLAYFYLSNSHTLSSVFGTNLMTHKAHNERLSHICDVILRYMLNDS
jgi:AcrR family transcriptional regulator